MGGGTEKERRQLAFLRFPRRAVSVEKAREEYFSICEGMREKNILKIYFEKVMIVARKVIDRVH